MTFNEWWNNEWHNVYDVALQGELQPKDFVQIGWNACLENHGGHATQYAFKTELILKDVGPISMPNSVYSAIAVNTGNADIEMFEAMWDVKCPNCPPSLTSGGFIGCNQCKGTGYIQPYDLAIAFVRSPAKQCYLCDGKGERIYKTGMKDICEECNGTGLNNSGIILWHVQLFSDKKGVDCGVIAQAFGGKGSVHEAEFDCRELPFEI